jgi:RHS repeat-associated protein
MDTPKAAKTQTQARDRTGPRIEHRDAVGIPSSSQQAASKVSSTAESAGTSSSSLSIPVLDSTAFATGKGGGALRSIDSNFSVNPNSGTLSFSVPLPVTKSRGSFQPSLSLEYDSGSGNGAFGIGWRLGGVSSIARKTSRCIPTYRQDDDGEDLDTFVLAGSEDLVPISDENVDGFIVRQYAPRVYGDTEMRVERWMQGSHVAFWRTISAENVTNIYGRDESSRELENPHRVFAWLLCESYDAYGNAILYTYKKGDDEGIDALPADRKAFETMRDSEACKRARYLKSIRYGNRTPSRDLEKWKIVPATTKKASEWCFSIVFDYGEHDLKCPTTSESYLPWSIRQDPFSTGSRGFEVRTLRLCRRVLMFHHFPSPTELCRDDYLVASMGINYQESLTGSVIEQITSNGHVFDAAQGMYFTQSMAPLKLRYSSLPDLERLRIGTVCPATLQNLHSSRPDAVTRWVDLDGEGSPGLLVQLDGTWYFQSNESAMMSSRDDDSTSISSSGTDAESDTTSTNGSETDKIHPSAEEGFGPIHELRAIPGLKDFTRSTIEDIDGNGCQDVVVVDEQGRVSGFYERITGGDGDESWTPLQLFPEVVNMDLKTAGTYTPLRLDMTGNGQPDLLLEVAGRCSGLAWHEALGKRGMDVLRECQIAEDASSPTTPPLRLTGDDRTAIYLVDMSGDGLQDIVRITNGHVSYWPNLGYGSFGHEVSMGLPCPLSQDDTNFTFERLHLLDVDGSGTTDIIYLPPEGGANVFFNQSGNTFSAPLSIPQFPSISRLSSVFALDLLGKGTSCLCWAGPRGGNGTDEVVINYLDLAAGGKPHLLCHLEDGKGSETRIKYCPSTVFYLRDKVEGKPWISRLPFPVHVVRRTVRQDHVSQAKLTTTYAYRDGFFDPHDREFRGFGAVNIWEREQMRLAPSLSSAKTYKLPARHTRTWFHTGAAETSLLPHGTFEPHRMQTVLPDNAGTSASASTRREAFRALKGLQARSEVYQKDGSSSSNTPISISETAFDVQLVRMPVARSTNEGGKLKRERPGITRVFPREQLTESRERQKGEDARLQHEMILERNDHGTIQRKLTVSYGCRAASQVQFTSMIKTLENGVKDAASALEKSLQRQQHSHAAMSVIAFTDCVRTKDDFYAPRVASTAETHFEGFQTNDALLDIAKLRREHDMAVALGVAAVLGKESRVYYHSANLDTSLPLGQIERDHVPIVVDRTLERAFEADHKVALHESITPQISETELANILTEAGFVQLPKDDRWWKPSSRKSFSATNQVAGSELASARKTFFTPTMETDVFQNTTRVIMDRHMLLPKVYTNAGGHRTQAENNYRTLTARVMTDCNMNRTAVERDALGNNHAISRMGKKEEQLGDDHVMASPVPQELVEDFLMNPTEDKAIGMLGGRGSLSLYSHRLNGDTPPYRIDITRDTHFHPDGDDVKPSKGNFPVKVTFFDPQGQTVQESYLASWDKQRWDITGCTSYDAKGHAIQTHHAFTRSSPAFVPVIKRTSPATVQFVDAAGRQVGQLDPDHTWSKTHITPWTHWIYDKGATLSIEDPARDPDVGVYMSALGSGVCSPSWLDLHRSGDRYLQAIGQKAMDAYANHATVLLYDGRGNGVSKIQGVQKNQGTQPIAIHFGYDALGFLVREVDALGRTVQTTQYNSLGQQIIRTSMDKSEELSLSDINNQPVYLWDLGPRSRCRMVYNKLRQQTETWIRTGLHGREVLWARTMYNNTNTTESKSLNTLGQVMRIEDQAGIRSFDKYDFKGTAVAETRVFAEEYKIALDWSAAPGPKMEEHVAYHSNLQVDALGRPFLEKNAHGRQTRRFYDLRGSVVGVQSKTNDEEHWTVHLQNSTFTADLLPVNVTSGNGTITQHEYDQYTRRLVNRRTRRCDGNLVEDTSHMYDCMGRIARTLNAAQETVFYRNQRVEPVNEYWYDVHGRLVKTTGREMLSLGQKHHQGPFSGPDMNGDIKQLTCYTETYKYDDAGNMLELRHDVADATIPSWTRIHRYKEPCCIEPDKMSNRLTSVSISGVESTPFRYNANGTMISLPGFSRVEWDAMDNLHCISTQIVKEGNKAAVPEMTFFVYDKDGTRVRKVTETSATGRKMKETLYLGPAAEHSLTYGGDGVTLDSEMTTCHLFSTTAGPGANALVTIEHYLKSVNSKLENKTLQRYNVSNNLEVDEDGHTISYEEYASFGTPTYVSRQSGIDASSAFRFAAYRRDQETGGMYYCNARYYIPWLGRWISPDPLDTVDGPNIYAYCGNDPVNSTDPKGTSCWPKFLTGWNSKDAKNALGPTFRGGLVTGTILVAAVPLAAVANAWLANQVGGTETFDHNFVASLGAYGFQALAASVPTMVLGYTGSVLSQRDKRQAEVRMTALEGKVTTLEGKVATLEGKVTTLEGKVTPLEDRVKELETKDTQSQKKIKGLEEKFAEHATKFSTLEDLVKRLLEERGIPLPNNEVQGAIPSENASQLQNEEVAASQASDGSFRLDINNGSANNASIDNLSTGVEPNANNNVVRRIGFSNN